MASADVTPTPAVTLIDAHTAKIQARRERVFLLLSGIFLGAMAMLNILGITRFIEIGPFRVALGVLPYPLTFLCTDLISELYGRRRANRVVWTGLAVNLLVISTMALGSLFPSVPADKQPPWQVLELAAPLVMPNGSVIEGNVELFVILYGLTASAIAASMVAYLAAQFCDVFLFHFWKRLTGGRHLWLRNNASTLVSQFVDSLAVITITFWGPLLRGDITVETWFGFVIGSYLFKFFAAMVDTPIVYGLVHYLSKYLEIDPHTEHGGTLLGSPKAQLDKRGG